MLLWSCGQKQTQKILIQRENLRFCKKEKKSENNEPGCFLWSMLLSSWYCKLRKMCAVKVWKCLLIARLNKLYVKLRPHCVAALDEILLIKIWRAETYKAGRGFIGTARFWHQISISFGNNQHQISSISLACSAHHCSSFASCSCTICTNCTICNCMTFAWLHHCCTIVSPLSALAQFAQLKRGHNN